MSGQKIIQFIFLTPRVSVPTAGGSENEILLPANNTSLLLDALDKTAKAHPHGNTSIVFDSLSALMLSVGFEKAYMFTRYALEMLASERATALFLLNPSAHDPKVASVLRGLFSTQVTYGNKGLRVIKLPHA